MRIRRLSPKVRTRFLASGLFMIGLSTTASLLSPEEAINERPGAQALPTAALAGDVTPAVQTARDCRSAG